MSAYIRPGVTVTQVFVNTQPAVAAFSLPNVVVGPAFQLVSSDLLGTYTGIQSSYAYASLMGGAQVDLSETAEDEVFPITRRDVAVALKNVTVEIKASADTGAPGSSLLQFTDPTSGAFQKVLAGDKVVVEPTPGVTIVAAQTDGQSSATSGQRDRLTAGTPGQFANVKVGDTVTVTGSSPSIAGAPTVIAKSGDTLKLSADINDGAGDSSAVQYSITGDRGVATAGSYRVKTKVDNNTLTLESPLPVNEAPLTYSVQRQVAEIDLPRVTTLSDPGFLPSANDVQLPAGLQYTLGSDNFDIVAATVYADYRALRNDMAASLEEFSSLADLQAFFGVDQIHPANPLAFGLNVALLNSVTPTNGLGLDGEAMSDELLSHENAFSVLKLNEMYAIVPLTQSPAVHQIYNTFVTDMSQPGKKKECVVLINRKIFLTEVLQQQSTTSTSLSGARTIVATQADGVSTGAQPTHLNDPTTDAFLNVQKGDTVVVVSGTNAIAGNVTVQSKTDNNNLVLSGAIVSGDTSDLVYYIVRQDGLAADGQAFYDRNASFISEGVAPGHYLNVLSGDQKGRYKIGQVVSEKDLVLAASINGVTSLQPGIDYQIDRDLSKSEQATALAGYSSSMGSRRVVNLWPDVLEGPVGSNVQKLPGFYGCCAYGALTTGLPTQRGFTNLSISGFLGLEHSTGYFNDEQLDTIAGGGTFVLIQNGQEQPLFCRHQLTTDRSSIKFQEYSVTKNVDFIAKYIRTSYGSFPGFYNIVDTTMDELRTRAGGIIKFLKEDTKLPQIGGVIKSGSLKSLAEDPDRIDTVKPKFAFDIPIPLNNLDVEIDV